jgi:hypothetical protein
MNQTPIQMSEKLPPATPLQEFLTRLQQTMDQPPSKADPIRGERERLIAILVLLTRFISRVSVPVRKTVNPFLMDQVHHLRQLDKGIQSPVYKAKSRAGSPADRYEIWNARRYVVAAIECHLLAKPNAKPDDEIRKIAQNSCLKRLIRNATDDAETRFRNVQLESAIKRWRKSFKEGTAPHDVQENWNRHKPMFEERHLPGRWMARGKSLLKNACNMARRITLPPPVGV